MKSCLNLLSERREMGDFRKSHLGLGEKATVGMFDNVLFDNSKLIMFDW